MGKREGFIAEAKNSDGRRTIFRFIHPKDDDWQDFPEEISIVWKYPGKELPEDELRAEMDGLEEALDPLLDEGMARLPLVITGLGSKEWVHLRAPMRGSWRS
ncbi:hypothetical protein [Haloferula sp. BvORR071]|uniref:hypothetical protein n=1 Tax=Haloferula sp. BvORR071 TaxID=1396141 RepID=UPI00055726C4|nr:hypothetical protein [Haloferula sp. BvORR071]